MVPHIICAHLDFGVRFASAPCGNVISLFFDPKKNGQTVFNAPYLFWTRTYSFDHCHTKSIKDDQDLTIQHGTTLYLKNLAFSTTQDRLKKVFSHLPSFSFARAQTKVDPKRPGGPLSTGYGFIGLKDTEAAKKALKSIHNFVLDGHVLYVLFTGRSAEEPGSKSTDPTSTKSRWRRW